MKKFLINLIRFFWHLFCLKPKILFLRFWGAKIGQNCKILTSLKNIDLAFLSYLSVGNNVTIAKNTLIFMHDGARSRMEKFGIKKAQCAEVILEDNVFVGAGSIILPGVHIGKNTIIGAGSLVNKDIPSNCIAGGNPIKIIKQLNLKSDVRH